MSAEVVTSPSCGREGAAAEEPSVIRASRIA